MGPDAARLPGDLHGDGDAAEAGLAALLETSEKAVEELGSTVPPAQLRALLILDRSGGLNLSRLAAQLGASASATSRLCDRMQAADLLTRERAAGSRREIVLLPTDSGRRLAAWIRQQRRAVLDSLLATMSPDGRAALLRGLRELAAASG
jgi:DNA-binding MarR family transcriptional regulator